VDAVAGVAADAGDLAHAVQVREIKNPTDPLYGERELVAAARLPPRISALYSGVLGDPATLATLSGIPPMDQLAWWRFLFRVGGRVLLPFVDEETNPLTFANDALGPERGAAALKESPLLPGALFRVPRAPLEAPNARFFRAEDGSVHVETLAAVAPGAAILVDYGDNYWDFTASVEDVRARLLDFVEVLRHGASWAAAARAAAATAAPGPLLPAATVKAFDREFGDPNTRRETRAPAAKKPPRPTREDAVGYYRGVKFT